MTSGLIHRLVPPVVNVMTVSFGSTEARDEVTAQVLTPVTVGRPKSVMQTW